MWETKTEKLRGKTVIRTGAVYKWASRISSIEPINGG